MYLVTKIKELKQVNESVQDQPSTTLTMGIEQTTQHELNQVLTKERILWRDKANDRWLKVGDANTSCFHLTTIAYRCSNHIHHLMNENNTRISDAVTVGNMFIDYYKSLFSNSSPIFSMNLQGLFEISVDSRMNEHLSTLPLATEIYKTVFQIQGNKSPMPDRMTPVFYKKLCNIIGKDIIMEVQQFFEEGKLSKGTNHTFITLIQKKKKKTSC